MPADIEQAVAEAGVWTDIPGVEAVGQGERAGRPVIRVLVSTEEAARRIPETVLGYAVVVDYTPPIAAQGGGGGR